MLPPSSLKERIWIRARLPTLNPNTNIFRSISPWEITLESNLPEGCIDVYHKSSQNCQESRCRQASSPYLEIVCFQ